MVVRQPENGHASLFPSFAGCVGSLGGINDAGIACGQMSSWSDDETDYGIPMTFRLKLALDHAHDAKEAIDIIISDSTCGYNFIVSNGLTPISYAVETTAHHFYVGTWSDPVESTSPCWQINDVVRRTNFFIDPTTAATQRDTYDISSFIRFIFRKNPDFPYWRHYQALSDALEDEWGTLTLNTTMDMLRNVYSGKTDILVFIAQLLGLLRTIHQWVACPKTGDMLVSFATPTESAFKNQVHYFNLYRLIA